MKPYRIIFAGVIVLLGLLGFWVLGSIQAAGPDQIPYVGSVAFEQMRQLVGSWETTEDKGQGPMKMKASYKVTAGGSAIVETIFEGAPMEMVTVYYDNPKRKLNMTHYCMLHNQPRMALKSAKANELTFDFSKGSDINPAKEDHMHALAITFDGKDKIVQHWTRSQPGKKPEVMEIAFTRVQ
ncbi:MAG: hypothetical protein HY203_03980 [Nitrospirae bacterium]|nr:hypothetical protein [Nitrospirota bacterium]